MKQYVISLALLLAALVALPTSHANAQSQAEMNRQAAKDFEKADTAQTDFSTFWKKFRSAVIAGDKATVSEMTKFPLSMPTFEKAVKNRTDFLRRYNEIFKGEANAAQCFASAEPRKESARRYEIYCPFKDTPKDWENAPIRFLFELTRSGWKFAGLDNVNE
jgi:ribosomal protein S20